MAEKFDASLSERYYEWLSIAPEDQPPTLYRLLGVRTFEDKPNVIENAADRQMSHLRTFQSGKHSAESQKILNHVASARVTLLNPEKKEQYDKLLREQMRLESESVLDDESSARQEELSTTLVGFLEAVEIAKLKEIAEETKKKAKPAEPRKPSKAIPVASGEGGPDKKLIIGGAITVGVLLIALIAVLVWRFGGGSKEEKPKEVANWLDMGGEKGTSSTPVQPTEPQTPTSTPNKSSASTSNEPVVLAAEIKPRMTVKAHQYWVMSVAFSPDGRTLATGGGMWKSAGELKLWDATTGKLKADLKGHPKIVLSVAFSPDGKTLLAGGGGMGGSGFVNLWDVHTLKQRNRVGRRDGWMTCVAVSPNGKLLVTSATRADSIDIWDFATGKKLRTLKGHRETINSVALSPDGETLASGGGDSNVLLWDVVGGKEIGTLQGHTGPISRVAFSPNGKTLASTSADKTIKLWDVRTSKERATLKGCGCLAFSPDGKTLASKGKGETTVRLWGVESEELLTTLEGHKNTVCAIAFSPDGKTLVSGGMDGTFKLWNLSGGKPATPPPTAVTSESTPTSPLVALNFEETSGKLLDSSGNNHHGRVVGNVLYGQPGKQGKALGFDGKGGHVVIEGSEKFDFNKDFTWAAWVKTENVNQMILAFTDRTGDWPKQGGKCFVVHNGLSLAVSGCGLFNLRQTVSDNKWHHVGVIVKFSRSSGEGTATFCLDGKLNTVERTWNVNLPKKELVVKVAFCNSNYGHAFNGLIDTVTIWNRALSPEEIAALAAGKTLEPPRIAGTEEPKEPDTVAVATPDQPTPKPPTPKKPVPSPNAQAEMLKQLDGVHKFSQRRIPAERLELAKELFEAAKKSQGGPVEKFVLLRKAMELAQSGGDAGLMMEAVDAICAEFQVDILEGKQNALAGFAKGASNLEEIRSFVEAADPVIDEAIAAGRYDIAVNIADAAYRLASGEGDAELRKRTYDRRNAVRKLALKWQGLTDARNTLKTTPDDPAANLAVGRWFCFERQDWEQGLPLLAKCSSPALRGIAEQELKSPPTTPDAQVKLADAWWNLAERVEGKEKDALMLHAGEWYTKALSGLPEGFVKAKVGKRLEEVGEVRRTEARITGKILQTISVIGTKPKSVAFSPKEPLLAVGYNDKAIRIWNATTGQLRHMLKGHDGSVESVAFSPDGLKLASASPDKTVKIWDVATWGLQTTLRGHLGRVQSVAYSPDGKMIASGGDADYPTVRLWDAATGQPVKTLPKQNGNVYALAFHPSGSFLASAGTGDTGVRLWHSDTDQSQKILENVQGVRLLEFSPNGTLLATSGGGMVALWDATTGQLRRSLGDKGGSIAFNRDGSILAVGKGHNKVVNLWEVATGRLLGTLEGHPDWVGSVDFSEDGSLLALRCDDMTVRVWSLLQTAPTSNPKPTPTRTTKKLPKESSPDPGSGVKKTFPISKWVPLLTSPNELVGWENVSEKVKYSNGLIELNDRTIQYPVVAKDMIIRAKVKKMSGQNLSLRVRKSDQGNYGAWFNGGGSFGIGKSVAGKGWKDLKKYSAPHNYNQGFEFAFAAVGDTLTILINRQPVMEVRDPTFTEGSPGLSACKGTSLFRDVEIQILKK